MRQTITQYNNEVGINRVDLKITYFTNQTASITILRYEKFQSSVEIIHFVHLFILFSYLITGKTSNW